MNVIRPNDVAGKAVAEPGAEGIAIRELITADTGAPTFAMRLFEVAPGGHSPLHTHDWEHEVYILEGEGEVVSAGGPQPFVAGDAVFVRPGERHQFRNNGAGRMRFLCMIPVQQACVVTKE